MLKIFLGMMLISQILHARHAEVCSLWILEKDRILQTVQIDQCLGPTEFCPIFKSTCTVSFFEENYFTTAAHCFEEISHTDQIYIDCDAEGKRFLVKQENVRVHENFIAKTLENDVAVGKIEGKGPSISSKLATPQEKWLKIKDVDLGTGPVKQTVFPARQKCYVAGYGQNKDKSYGYYREIKVTHYDVVGEWALQPFDHFLSFVKTFDLGDSGGPIFCIDNGEKVSVGVVSYLIEGEVENPNEILYGYDSVYNFGLGDLLGGLQVATFIPDHYDWIIKQVESLK